MKVLGNSGSVVLRLKHACESPGGFVHTQVAGCTPEVSDAVGLGWGPRICISNMLPGDAGAVDPERTVGEPLVQMISQNRLQPWTHLLK